MVALTIRGVFALAGERFAWSLGEPGSGTRDWHCCRDLPGRRGHAVVPALLAKRRDPARRALLSRPLNVGGRSRLHAVGRLLLHFAAAGACDLFVPNPGPSAACSLHARTRSMIVPVQSGLGPTVDRQIDRQSLQLAHHLFRRSRQGVRDRPVRSASRSDRSRQFAATRSSVGGVAVTATVTGTLGTRRVKSVRERAVSRHRRRRQGLHASCNGIARPSSDPEGRKLAFHVICVTTTGSSAPTVMASASALEG